MEYTSDIGAEWPNFSDIPIPETAALHIADSEAGGAAWRAFVDLGHPGRTLFAVYLSNDPDKPLNRGMSFWKRHAELASIGPTHEADHATDGWVRRVAFLELASADDARKALLSTAARRFQRALVATSSGFDTEALMDSLVRAPEISMPNFQVRGFLPWLIRSTLRYGAVVARFEDGADGRPGLGIYGQNQDVERIRDKLLATLQ